MPAPPVDVADRGWSAVARDVLSLKERLGFHQQLHFMHFHVPDDGRVIFVNPITGTRLPVGERLERITWAMLQVHARTGEDLVIDEADERFTRISLLDDSMHLGCSTNQHRIEGGFQALIDAGVEVMGEILERYFAATRVDKGDLACRVALLPRVPVLLVYHAGEEGLPSSAGLFFEVHALRFLDRIACESLEELFLHAARAIHETVTAGHGPGA